MLSLKSKYKDRASLNPHIIIFTLISIDVIIILAGRLSSLPNGHVSLDF